MQNRGAILTFAILLALVSLYQLSFTFKTRQVEKAARAYAQGDPEKEFNYLDSISGEEVYNFLGLKKFTFKEVKELELNLGLDLRGGMNVTLEVAVDDLIRALSHYNTCLLYTSFNSAWSCFFLGFENLIFLLRCNHQLKIIRVMNIAVNNDVKIPIINVVAKPLIGPEPNM